MNRRIRPSFVAAAALLVVALPSQALYKVVGPDGRITYTDRPPASAPSDRVTPLSAAGAAPAAVPLPLELRLAAARYPVTLYVTANCEPCDSARQLLRQRGVPHAERQIKTAEDGEALLRLSGAQTAPTLTIGQQVLKGLSAEVWNAYLDSAGYPRESRLPVNYAFEVPTPLTQRREAVAAPVAAASRPSAARPSDADRDTATPAAGGIRF